MHRNNQKEPLTLKASGFRDLLGMELVELNAERAIMELTLEPKHLNSQGTLHGGALAALVDNTGGLAGCYCPQSHGLRKAVTLSLTTSFIAAASSGTVRAIARKRSGGRNIFIASVEVFDELGKLIAIGEATYRYFNERS